MIRINSIQSCSSEYKSTIICRGTYNSIPAFFKIFNNSGSTIDELSLIYESNVYKRIQQSSVQQNQFFIPVLGCEDIELDRLVSYCVTRNVKKTLGVCLYRLGTNFRCIITEDTGSMTLTHMLVKGQLSEIEVVNILSMIVVSIYVLNVYFGIQHNDMHFNNILVKKEPESTDYEFTNVDGRTYTISSNIRIYIYDFDRSYMEGQINPILTDLCLRGEGCNTISYKDYFVFVQSLLYFYHLHTTTHVTICSYIRRVLKEIIPSHTLDMLDRRMLDDILEKNRYFWSSYCLVENISKQNTLECLDTSVQDDATSYYLPHILPKLLMFRTSLVQENKKETLYNFMINKIQMIGNYMW